MEQHVRRFSKKNLSHPLKVKKRQFKGILQIRWFLKQTSTKEE
jgi:hypothetical protein